MKKTFLKMTVLTMFLFSIIILLFQNATVSDFPGSDLVPPGSIYLDQGFNSVVWKTADGLKVIKISQYEGKTFEGLIFYTNRAADARPGIIPKLTKINDTMATQDYVETDRVTTFKYNELPPELKDSAKAEFKSFMIELASEIDGKRPGQVIAIDPVISPQGGTYQYDINPHNASYRLDPSTGQISVHKVWDPAIVFSYGDNINPAIAVPNPIQVFIDNVEQGKGTEASSLSELSKTNIEKVNETVSGELMKSGINSSVSLSDEGNLEKNLLNLAIIDSIKNGSKITATSGSLFDQYIPAPTEITPKDVLTKVGGGMLAADMVGKTVSILGNAAKEAKGLPIEQQQQIIQNAANDVNGTIKGAAIMTGVAGAGIGAIAIFVGPQAGVAAGGALLIYLIPVTIDTLTDPVVLNGVLSAISDVSGTASMGIKVLNFNMISAVDYIKSANSLSVFFHRFVNNSYNPIFTYGNSGNLSTSIQTKNFFDNLSNIIQTISESSECIIWQGCITNFANNVLNTIKDKIQNNTSPNENGEPRLYISVRENEDILAFKGFLKAIDPAYRDLANKEEQITLHLEQLIIDVSKIDQSTQVGKEQAKAIEIEYNQLFNELGKISEQLKQMYPQNSSSMLNSLNFSNVVQSVNAAYMNLGFAYECAATGDLTNYANFQSASQAQIDRVYSLSPGLDLWITELMNKYKSSIVESQINNSTAANLQANSPTVTYVGSELPPPTGAGTATGVNGTLTALTTTQLNTYASYVLEKGTILNSIKKSGYTIYSVKLPIELGGYVIQVKK